MRNWIERMMLKMGFVPQEQVTKLEDALVSKTSTATTLRHKLLESQLETAEVRQERDEILSESGLEVRWALRSIHERAEQILQGVRVG